MIAEELCKVLDGYVEKVAHPRDKVLFAEAIESAKVSALRSAYITLWLSCVESLKRRFQELSVRDFGAADVVMALQELEAKRMLVDDYLLEQVEQRGLAFVRDVSKLKQICALQRLCSRPYEQGPKLAEFISDAKAVVEILLGQPTQIEMNQISDQIYLMSKQVDMLSTTLQSRLTTQNSNPQ